MSCTEHRSLGSAWIEYIREEFTRKDITQYPLTSSQYFRSTDLPSLRTQSNILVLMPFPQTAFSLSWHVLQSERKGAHQNRRLCRKQISNETLMTWIPYLIHNCFLSRTINHPTCRAYGARLWTYQEANGSAGVAHSYRDYSWRQMSTWQSWQLAVWWQCETGFGPQIKCHLKTFFP